MSLQRLHSEQQRTVEALERELVEVEKALAEATDQGHTAYLEERHQRLEGRLEEAERLLEGYELMQEIAANEEGER